MAARAMLAVVLMVCMLGVGLVGMSLQAQNAQDAANTTTENDSYAIADGVYGGVGTGLSAAAVWGGVAAVLLIACGIAVGAAAKGGGRR